MTTSTMDPYPNQEQRRRIRWMVAGHYLQVFDKTGNILLGHVKDIHTQGLRLVSEHIFTCNEEKQICLEPPPNGGKRTLISLQVRCAWRESNNSLGLYEAGFEIISSPEIQQIETLVKHLQEFDTGLRKELPTNFYYVLKKYGDSLIKYKKYYSNQSNLKKN